MSVFHIVPSVGGIYPLKNRWANIRSLKSEKRCHRLHAPSNLVSPCSLGSPQLQVVACSTADIAAADADASEPSTSGRKVPKGFSVRSADGQWLVRPVYKSKLVEVRRVVELQTEAFHVPNAIPFVDSALKSFFKAEVLSEMRKKLKYNPASKFVCLVVESAQPSGGSNSSSGGGGGSSDSDGGSTAGSGVVGVVEVSLIDEKEILQSLEPGTVAFPYIASMAVDPSVRRQGAATALLAAAEQVAAAWQEQQALLHVYQDNAPAIELYQANGFSTIYHDAPWLAKLAVRPRFLMRKRFA